MGTDSKTSGMKRVFLDNTLKCEKSVFPAPTFRYSWRLEGHRFAIVPKEIVEMQSRDAAKSYTTAVKNVFNKTVDCDFELQINDLPFQVYQHQGMLLFVHTTRGETLTLDVNDTDSIAAVKAQIKEMQGHPIDEQILVYAGKRLKDTRALLHYKIGNGATVHLVVSAPGKKFQDSEVRAGTQDTVPHGSDANPDGTRELHCHNPVSSASDLEWDAKEPPFADSRSRLAGNGVSDEIQWPEWPRWPVDEQNSSAWKAWPVADGPQQSQPDPWPKASTEHLAWNSWPTATSHSMVKPNLSAGWPHAAATSSAFPPPWPTASA